MKLKVRVIGHKVHDVGYRYFLMSNAIDLGLEGFSAHNRMSGDVQEVMAMVEGDEGTINDFAELIETKRPEHAEVSSICFEEYNGNVMRAGEYAQVCTALQLNKAIPLLLDMKDDIKAVRKNTDSTLEEIKAVRKTTDSTLEEIKAVRKNTDSTLEEIRGLREDIQPGYAIQFRQMQADIQAIKERLGMQ
ncbi:MAG: acylphosphatase [Methanothrix sp.]|nr:acylphosphatase [Methanothrix sp.]